MWYWAKRNARTRCQFPIDFTSPRGGGENPPTPLYMNEFNDIRDYPEVLDAITASLKAKNIIEVKREPKGVAVVEIKRQVKTIAKAE